MSAPTITPKATIWLSLKNNTWKDMDDVRDACRGKPVLISGNTLDLKGCQICGTKLPKPDNDQDENSVPLRINIPGFTLKNGSVRGIPGGIVGRKERHVYLDLVFLDIGEDALSNVLDDSPDWVVRKCRFFGANDKSLQANDARNITVEECEFNGGITGCRLQKKGGKYKKPRTKSIKNNVFNGCDTAWNISGEIQVVASGNKYNRVDQRVVKNTGATFTGT